MMIGKTKWLLISLLLTTYTLAADVYVYQTERGPVVSLRPLPALESVVQVDQIDLMDRTIYRAAHRFELDPELIRAIISVESAFNPSAVSEKGAMGLMQLMPTIANAYAVTDPFDIEQNVYAGSRFFSELMRKYGDIRLALAAYNAGEPAVDARAAVPNFPETRAYIDKVLARYQP